MRRCGKPANLHGLMVPCMLDREHRGKHRPSSREDVVGDSWIDVFRSHCEVRIVTPGCIDSEVVAVTKTLRQAKKILAKLRR